MTTKRSINIGICVAAMSGTLAATALAGTKTYPNVTISGNKASGAMSTVRQVSGNQYITCTAAGLAQNVSCSAVKNDGTSAYCTTPAGSAGIRALLTAGSLTSDAYVEFTWDANHVCTSLRVRNSSEYEPKPL